MTSPVLTMKPLFNENGVSSRKSRIDMGQSRYFCDCCPYGYHIDLDFVRFCETYSKQSFDSPSKQRRRERRRNRQSMEVLLGIAEGSGVLSSPNLVSNQRPLASPHVSDSLQKAVLDFEEALEKSSNRLSGSSQWTDTTIPPPDGFNAGQCFDYESTRDIMSPGVIPLYPAPTISNDSDNASAGSNTSATLQNIREQMATSLEKMKELEDQVKVIPKLQIQLSHLKEEKKKLLQQLQEKDAQYAQLKMQELQLSKVNEMRKQELQLAKLNEIDKDYYQILKKNKDNCSFEKDKKDKISTREVAVSCTSIMRDVGVMHSGPRLYSISTNTPVKTFSVSSIQQEEILPIQQKESIIDRLSKQLNPSVGVQVSSKLSPLQIIEKRSIGVQVVEEVRKSHASIQVKVAKSDVSVGIRPLLKDTGSSDCTIDEIMCEKCKSLKQGVALNALGMTRSKSFDYSNTSPNLKRRHLMKNVSCSTDIKLYSRGTNTENLAMLGLIRTVSCGTDVKTQSRAVNTVQPKLERREIGVNTKVKKFADVSVGDSTKMSPKIENGPSICDKCNCTIRKVANDMLNTNIKAKSEAVKVERPGSLKVDRSECVKVERSESIKSEKSPLLVSKIPRPKAASASTSATSSPKPTRKVLTRQDTYTKVCITPPLQEPEKSSLPSISSSSNLKSKLNASEPNLNAGSDGSDIVSPVNQERSFDSEDLLFQPIDENREKASPSPEMKGAMKVLNDHLKKVPINQLPQQLLKNAINIIQQEWFKVSSLAAANHLVVEDYLECIEEYSTALLEFIVNLRDASGNTAMHYAVSHGNFDVVAALLDSKVCNINMFNYAGFTCSMLVALTEIKSDTHLHVVKRLFQLADINIRATGNGQTALMLAAARGKLVTAQLLVQCGADVNVQDNDGSTALMCAAELGYIDIVNLLIAQPDCDLTITDHDGSTALNIAMDAGHRNIGVVLYAQQHFARGASPFAAKGKRSKSATPAYNHTGASRPTSSRALTPQHSPTKEKKGL
nr:PREDICTED: KN motif and ankyrin repeat domain-containing protein 1-like [Bemisia tabaci]